MQLRDYWRLLRKWWLLVVVVAAVAAVGAYGYSKSQERIYRSSVVLLVSPSRLDYGLSLVVQGLMRQYSRQIDSDTLAEAVDNQLQLDISPQRLRSKVKVSPITEDYLIQIDVYDPDPNRAMDIARTWGKEFVKTQAISMASVDPTSQIVVKMLDNPLPGVLDSPKTMPNVMAGGLLGILVGVLLALALEFTNDNLKTAEDIERYVHLPLLGTIPVHSVHTRGDGPASNPDVDRAQNISRQGKEG